MEILVIGGSKFIGLSIINKLLEMKSSITVFNLEDSNSMSLSGVRHIRGNRKDHALVRKLFEKEHFDVIIDTCGFEPEDVNIFIELFGNKIKQYIFCSTVSVYDFDKIKSFPIKEDFPVKADPESKNNEIRYGSKKALCEKVLMSNGKFPVTIIRPCYVYGPNAYGDRVEFFFNRIGDERVVPILPIGNNVMQFIYISDLADLFVSAVNNQKAYNQIYNAAGEESTTIFNFINLCEEIIGKKADIRVFDAEKLTSILDEEELPGIIPTKLYHISFYFDNLKAIRDLDWKPKTTLYEGLKETYDWHRQNRKAVNYCIDEKLLKLLNGSIPNSERDYIYGLV